jgi:DNA-binding MarR family transcriptional regulator
MIMEAALALGRMTKRYGVTTRQLTALLVIDDYPEITQGELARRMGFNKRLASEVVARLVRDGMIVRRRSVAHKGAYALSLTRKAKRRADEYRAAQRAIDRRVERAIGADDLPVVEAALTNIIEMEAADG